MKELRLMLIKDKSEQSSSKNEIVSTHYTIDDSIIFDAVDETLANVDITILEKAKNKI